MKNTGNRAKIEYLSRFMTEERLGVMKDTLDMRTRYIAVCVENTFHPHNASALVRSCEAFGIQDMYTVEELCRFDPSTNIVKGTDKWVDIHRHGSTPELISHLKNEGFRIVATSPHEGGSTPETFDVAKGKFALFFGTEHEGISDEVGDAACEFIRIPMYGFVESLNVSVSAAILLYILSTRMREAGAAWQMSEAEKDGILFRWMTRSVKDAENIMKRFQGNA